MEKISYRQDIQILRGISVLLVILYHLKIPGFNNGFLGVDIFLILSGYLMAQVYVPGSKMDFFSRRAKRLLPSYLSTIIFTVLVSYFMLIPSDFKQLINQTRASLFLIPNLYFWNLDSYFTNTHFNPLLNLWSLGIEFQFYLFVPLITSIFIKNKKILLLICIISMISSFIILTISPKTSFFLLPLRLWEFLIGFLIYKYNKQIRQVNNLRLLYSLSIPAFILIILNLPIEVYSTSIYTGHPGIISLTTALFTVLILSLNLPNNNRLWSVLFEKVGDYSYSIYLVHFPIIVLWNYQSFDGTRLGIEKINDTPLLLILIFFSSILTFIYVETPLRKFRYNFKLIIIPVIILIILSNFVNFFHEKKFSSNEVKISNAFLDRSHYRCGKIFRILNPTSLICPLNKGSKNTNILLLGNSHADSIKETFKKISEDYETNSYFWVQNNPLMVGGASANQVYGEVIDYKISHVFLHYSGAAVDPETLSVFLKKLSNAGIFVTILGPVPGWSNSIPYMMWNEYKFSNELNSNYDNYYAENKDELNNYKSLLNEKIQYFDTGALFCDIKCRYSNGDQVPYYWDTGHLTLTGARYMEKPLSEIFKNYFIAVK